MNFYIKSNTNARTSINMDIIIVDVFGLRENIFPGVVTSPGIWIIAPVSEHSQWVSYPQALKIYVLIFFILLKNFFTAAIQGACLQK